MSASEGSLMPEKKLQKVAADSGCFVCGENNPIGFKAVIEVDQEQATSWTKVKLPAEFQGWRDVVHGGVIAALLDEVCIYACRARAEQCVTAELQVRYRKPVPIGSEVEVFGQLVDCERKFWQAAGQLKIEGTLYAEAQAKVYILDERSG
jgi:uncharacterized protein (TIGR00369 family)